MAINIEEKDINVNRISQVNIGGVTYSLKDTATRSALSAVEARVTVNEENITNNAAAIAGITEAIKGGVSYLGKI